MLRKQLFSGKQIEILVCGLVLAGGLVLGSVTHAGQQEEEDMGGPLREIIDLLTNLQPAYIPFVVTIEPDELCAAPGAGSPGSQHIAISSDSPFALTSVRVVVFGLDETTDNVFLTNVVVDGASHNAFTVNIFDGNAFRPNIYADLMTGFTHLDGAGETKSSLQLSANGGGNPDIEFTLSCDASIVTDITLHRVQVSGWKDPNASVVVETP